MLAALALTPAPTARAQFSPGKLSKAHAALEGTTQCFKCHEPRKATTAERCFACHRPVGNRLAAGKGLHAGLVAARDGKCGQCHPEHGGLEGKLVSWPGGRDAFDHRRTGFVVDGKHTSLRCEDCHQPELVRAEDVRASDHLSLQRTYLGLSPRCADCHRDPHHGQFEAAVRRDDCAGCHSTQGWKPARFDHARARFPLDGKHAALACERCHFTTDAAGAKVATGTPGAFALYRPLGLECSACHSDPHQNRYGADCRRCHSTGGWKELALGKFDHSRTRFALAGEHARVACERCHWSENEAGKKVAPRTPGARPHWKPLTFQKCTDCHQDPHRQRFGSDCARCHSSAGWRTITAGAFDHDKTRYPLRGAHRERACAKCHRGGDTSKPLAFAACSDCHADAHQEQLAARADRGACESCHGVEGFVPARFGPAEHAATRFPLQDAHRAVACLACHRQAGQRPAPASASSPALAAGTSAVVLHFEDRSCAACHRDPHAGQFVADGRTDCARCHGAASWRLPGFDHARTRFPLDGSHARAACASCHRTESATNQRFVRYRPLDTACRACHTDMQPQKSKGGAASPKAKAGTATPESGHSERR